MGENNLALFVLKEDLSLLSYEENIVSEFEVPLVSGAARYGEGQIPQFCLRDDSLAEGISDKYDRFGYFTSWYWVWKNADADFVGIVSDHAHFDLSDEEIVYLFSTGADAVLPVTCELPMSLGDFYKEQYYGYDLEMLKELVKIREPEYYDTLILLLEHPYMFTRTCGIYKAEILNAFCHFAFPLLEVIDEMSEHHPDQEENQVMEHLGDILHYVFFMKHFESMCLKQAPFYEVAAKKDRVSRILSEYDILQYTKQLFKERHMSDAVVFLNSLDEKRYDYADVRRIRNMLAIHCIERKQCLQTVLDRKPDVDALIKHHENLENYIANYISGTCFKKDLIRYIDSNGVTPQEVLYMMQYFDLQDADAYVKFITLFQEYGKMEFVLPFMEAAVQKRNCIASVEAKMREVVQLYG